MKPAELHPLIPWLLCVLAVIALPVMAADEVDKEPVATEVDLDPDKLAKVFAALGHEAWEQREQAQAVLLKLGERAPNEVTSACLDRFVASEDPEVRVRLRQVILPLAAQHIYDGRQGSIGLSVGSRRLPEVIGEQLLYPFRVLALEDEGPAVKAGIQPGDRIIRVGDHPVDRHFTTKRLYRLVRIHKPGDKLEFGIWRNSEKKVIEVTVGQQEQARNEEQKRRAKLRFLRAWFQEELARRGAADPPPATAGDEAEPEGAPAQQGASGG